MSCVSSAPRWLLARTFESLKNKERKAKFPDVVAGGFGVATGRRVHRNTLNLVGGLFLPFAYNGESLEFFLAKARLIIQGDDDVANYLLMSIGGGFF